MELIKHIKFEFSIWFMRYCRHTEDTVLLHTLIEQSVITVAFRSVLLDKMIISNIILQRSVNFVNIVVATYCG